MSHNASNFKKSADVSSKVLLASSPFYKQKGSALVLALFIIIVMTVLGAALTRMMQSSSETIAYEVLGTRAYAAAQTGVQWKLQQLFPLGNNTFVSCSDVGVDIPPPDVSSTEGLKSCKISEVTCSDFQYTDVNSNTINAYTVTSTGECYVTGGTDTTLTSRTIRVEARSL